MGIHVDSQNLLHSADGVTSPVSVSAEHGTFFVTMKMSEAAFKTLDKLAESSGQPLDQVISKAFLLYKAAADAHKDGKSVGVAPSPDVLETEFVGI